MVGIGLNGEVTLAGVGALLAGAGSLLTAIVAARLSWNKGKEEAEIALVGDSGKPSPGGNGGSPGSDSPGSEQSGAD